MSVVDEPKTGYRYRIKATTGCVGTTDELSLPHTEVRIDAMPLGDQYDYLKVNMDNAKANSPKRAGEVAVYFREYVQNHWLKLDDAFDQKNHPVEYKFFNTDLRDFLNYSENGADDYTWEEVTKDGSGWHEVASVGSAYHQTNQFSSEYLVIEPTGGVPTSVYTRLNAKFMHSDGREAVFKYVTKEKGELITEYPDRGTFNYYPGICPTLLSDVALLVETRSGGLHDRYDVQPFNDVVPPQAVVQQSNIPAVGGLLGNSKCWIITGNEIYVEMLRGRVVGRGQMAVFRVN